jgi:hypothetical protein
MMELSRQKILIHDFSLEIVSEEEEEINEISSSYSDFTTDDGMTWVKENIDLWYQAN